MFPFFPHGRNMKKNSKFKWEWKCLEYVLSRRTLRRNRQMIFLTHLGTGGILWILLAGLFFANKKYRMAGCNMILSMVCSAVFCNLLLKPFIKRQRPSWIDPRHLLIGNPSDYSFPSGHTTSSFAAATTLFYYDTKLAICLVLIACLIAFSRIYHYVHYPTDVAVGILLGILCAVVGHYLFVQKFLPILVETVWAKRWMAFLCAKG